MSIFEAFSKALTHEELIASRGDKIEALLAAMRTRKVVKATFTKRSDGQTRVMRFTNMPPGSHGLPQILESGLFPVMCLDKNARRVINLDGLSLDDITTESHLDSLKADIQNYF